MTSFALGRELPNVENFLCPILGTIMKDPVVCSDGHTYERAAIEEWIRTCEDVDVLSPMTGFPLKSKILFANHALKRSIMALLQDFPELKAQETTPEDVASIVKERRFPTEKEELLIDLRSEEEIKADELAKQSKSLASHGTEGSVVVGVTRITPWSSEISDGIESQSSISAYSLVSPSVLMLATKYSHHSIADELNLYQSDLDGNYSKSHTVKLPPTDSVLSSSFLRIPAYSTGQTVEAEYVVIGGSTGRVRILEYDRANKTLDLLETNEALKSAHYDSIRTVSTWPHSGLSGDKGSSPLVISGSRDKTLKVWKAETSSPSLDKSWNFELAAILRGHTDFVTCSDVEISSGILLSGGEDWKACLWDLNRLDAGCVTTFNSHSYGIRCCSWSTSGQHSLSPYENGAYLSQQSSAVFATGGDDEMVYVTDPRARGDGRVARLSTGSSVLTCCWGPTDEQLGQLPWLAAGGGLGFESFSANSDNVEGWVRVYDPRMWKSVGDCCSYNITPMREEAHSDASAGSRRGSLMNRENSSCEGDSNKTRQAHKTVVSALSPVRVADGTVALASCGGDEMVRIWKLPHGPGGLRKPKLYQNMPGPVSGVNSCMGIL